MTISAGTKLGPYEILAAIGAGGMGEVYRARDTRLGRDVAVKVLPQHLASTPEIRARFEREARAVSSLNHPNICTLHDVGHESGTDFLVMELVEGETLSARLEKGPLPAPELLRYGIEIADALDKAHRQGLVHRDLKPGNIMITKAGAKLLDFGLARATGLAASTSGLSQSPTMSHPLTAEGTIVGTFQYMAPEQLEGQEADARTDLFAYGAVLYEMATGKKAFEGKSQASLIAAILEREPAPLSAVTPLTPPGLERVVRACLAKDPNDRIQTAHDVKLQLQWIAEGGSQAGVPAPIAAPRRGREAIAWTLVGVAALAAAGLGASLLLRRPEAPRVTRFDVRPPQGTTNINWPRLSPDGRLLAFLANDSSGVTRIWVRPVDAFEAHVIPGTEGSGRPFWSPDSRFLAYISGGKLRKVPVAGGPVVTVADVPGGADGSWGAQDVILFDGGASDSIRSVPASGGTVKPATSFDRTSGETAHSWPYFLPDGRHFLYTATAPGGPSDVVKIGTLGSTKSITLGRTDGRVEYAPPGYLVFIQEGSLMAQPFDARALRTRGDPVPVGENVTLGQASGHFSVSGAGLLAYRAERAEERSQLVWVDRDGRPLGDAGPPGQYRDLALSPDGSQVAVSIVDAQSNHEDIWVRQLARGVTSRLTFDRSDEVWPLWSPDGSRVHWASNRAGEFRGYSKLASGVGSEDSLQHVPGGAEGATSIARDGSTIVTTNVGAGTGWDIWNHPTGSDRKPAVFLQTPFNERNAQLSPDGRWIAYNSNETARSEIYVQAFPDGGGKWQISTGGGFQPYWRADGRELFFRTPDQAIMAVEVRPGASFEVGVPITLFRSPLVEAGYTGYRWAPSADGRRFLLNVPVGGASAARFAVITDWTSELKKR